MSISIGDNNHINNSVISSNSDKKEKNIISKHPFISSVIASIIGGLILFFIIYAITGST